MNPHRSMRKMASELKISTEKVRHIVNNELGLHPYKLQKAHCLTERMKRTRLERCRKLLTRAARNAHKTLSFRDESLFTIEQTVNKQNDRILTPDIQTANERGRIIPKQAHPQSVMIWREFSPQVKTPLVFIPDNVKVNAETYRKQILEPL